MANDASFITDPANAFMAGGAKLVRDKALASGRWERMGGRDSESRHKSSGRAVGQYERQVEELRRIVMVLMHSNGWMSARGTEFMTLKTENTWGSMRNLFSIYGAAMNP